MFERISINPRVCHGQACIRGTRIPVHQIVAMIANGDSIEDLLKEYPSLEREDIQEAVNYATALIVRGIVDAVHPLRILLFGSAARGDWNCNSDVDLLVVVPEDIHRRRTAQHIYSALKDMPVPFDVVVAHPSDLERHRDNPGLVYQAVLKEGHTVYAS